MGRPLHRQGIFPPVDILPCLSRLMNNGIGEGRTEDWHREWSNQLYASYARGRDVRKLMAIVGEDALTPMDKNYLNFAVGFEKHMVGQGTERRSIDETFALGWKLMGLLPRGELTRVSREVVEQYYEAQTPEDFK
jgi:V/A-type H+-transporting ATPase subunit B